MITIDHAKFQSSVSTTFGSLMLYNFKSVDNWTSDMPLFNSEVREQINLITGQFILRHIKLCILKCCHIEKKMIFSVINRQHRTLMPSNGRNWY